MTEPEPILPKRSLGGFQFDLRTLLIRVIITGLVLGLGWATWSYLFGDVVNQTFRSTSPDGMFRATLTELVGRFPWGHGRHAQAVVERLTNQVRDSKNEKERWDEVKRVPIEIDDSVSVTSYDLDWRKDAAGKTTALRISGNAVLPRADFRDGAVVVKLVE